MDELKRRGGDELAFRREFYKYNSTKNINSFFAEFNSFEACLLDAFKWRDSKQDVKYWKNICNLGGKNHE